MARTQKIKIINILLSSIDGKIASHSQESTAQRRQLKWTNDDDFQHMRKLTAQCDGVLIGARTLNSEIGAFRVADLRKDKTEPHWFIMTKSGAVNHAHPFWQQQKIPKSIFHFDGMESLVKFFDDLRKKKIKKLALLGGGELNGFFWENDLVSELYLTISPLMIGTQNAPSLLKTNQPLHKQLKLVEIRNKKNFLFLHYIKTKNAIRFQNSTEMITSKSLASSKTPLFPTSLSNE